MTLDADTNRRYRLQRISNMLQDLPSEKHDAILNEIGLLLQEQIAAFASEASEELLKAFKSHLDT